MQILINNVLDIWALVDPERILTKPKLHILPHVLQDIRNFGPAILYSTEVFECFNAVFRFCSILSNHHAPSLDIARALADLERFKHVVSGGWWKQDNGEYTRAGEKVRSFLECNPKLQQSLGWAQVEDLQPGESIFDNANSKISFTYVVQAPCSLHRATSVYPGCGMSWHKPGIFMVLHRS